MTTTAPVRRIEVDGRPATAENLLWPALNHPGHFTAMQVRGGKVRGIGHHLARLDAATRELFGHELDGERVRALIRHILRGDPGIPSVPGAPTDLGGSGHAGNPTAPGGSGHAGNPAAPANPTAPGGSADAIDNASLRIHVHAPAGHPSVMVTVRPPTVLPVALTDRAQSLMSVPYQRPFAHLKLLGGFAQARYGELARRAGFDDALLTGPGGEISEGAVTNIAFYDSTRDGPRIVWPNAPHLAGVTMRLLESRLPAAGLPTRHAPVTLADLPSYTGAFVTNAWGVSPVRRIDSVAYEIDEKVMARVAAVYEDVPWDTV
ncbi:aminotransferase class IV [Streptomyces huasconensis]|uniref:Aminotransferase class IV n=1 Tax=Streptomyces huasconensis TaxID=1854574 RepID=A0ABV3LQ92_9ACTN